MYPYSIKIIIGNLILFPLITFLLIDIFDLKSISFFRIFSFCFLLIFNIIFYMGLKNDFRPKYKNQTMLIFLTTVIFMFLLFLMRILVEPFGMWDAWAIWNFKAKDVAINFILKNQHILFKENWNHPGYPLFVPYQIAFVSIIFGTYSEIISYLIHVLYLYLFVCLMFYFLSLKFEKNLLFITLFPFTLFQLYTQSSDLCADFPLSIFSAYCLYFYINISNSKKNKIFNSIYLGVILGILPHLKNEGFFIYIIYFIFFIFDNLKNKKSLQYYSWIPISLIFSLSYVIYKYNAPQILQFQITLDEIVESFRELKRWKNIGLAFTFFHLFYLYATLPIFLFYYKLNHHIRIRYLIPIFVLYSIYNGIFFITRLDQLWHISTAYARVNFQLSPILFFTIQYIHFISIKEKKFDSKKHNI